jgi:hypothetical protein
MVLQEAVGRWARFIRRRWAARKCDAEVLALLSQQAMELQVSAPT